MTKDEAENILKSVQYWHYSFDLPWGRVQATKPHHDRRHQLRRRHFFEPLLDYYQGALHGKTVLDLGCCQGLWSFEAHKNGAAQCVGIDSSDSFVLQAEALQTILGFARCSFRCADLEQALWHEDVGTVDITLFLGLFYHLADPVHVLRKAMHCTRETIIVDTEVLPRDEPLLVIIARDADEPTTCRSNLSTKIRQLPTCSALQALLRDGGFDNMSILQPSTSMPDEYLTWHRLTIMAHRGKQ
jgi:SAM-dependent methyltransferase